jgi:carboxypeptidase Q
MENRPISSRNKPCLPILVFITLVFVVADLAAQVKNQSLPFSEFVEKAKAAGLRREGAYEYLRQLTAIGPRLTGSPQAAAAVELMRQNLTDLGLDLVTLEPVSVQHWVRGAINEARITQSAMTGTRPLAITALGGSVPTPEAGLSAPVLEVGSFEELHKRGKEAKEKIVFYNRPMDRTHLDTFQAYGEASQYRTQGAIEAAKEGALAVLVRSLTLRIDDFPHTGMLRYEPGVTRIPAAAISTSDAEFLAHLLEKEPGPVIYLNLECRELAPAISANVLGQMTGAEKPKEIILLGAHLDSWDLGTGAHDDGAGCAQVLEALSLIKNLRLAPRRSIRGVLFMNEEFGGTGGRDYALQENRKKEKHLAAIESDRGGFLPLGFSAGGNASALSRLKTWEAHLKPLGLISGIRPGGGGVDIGPLAAQGASTIGLTTDSQRYFDVHHSALDVLSSVNPRELELGAIAMAALAYFLAQEGI